MTSYLKIKQEKELAQFLILPAKASCMLSLCELN